METSDGLSLRVQYLDDTDPFASTIFPEPTRPPCYGFNEFIPLIDQIGGIHRLLNAPHKLEDCTLQLSHNGLYLDLESSIDEQRDDFEGFQNSEGRRNSILLRTQLSVRVHACIGTLIPTKSLLIWPYISQVRLLKVPKNLPERRILKKTQKPSYTAKESG
ncbi:FH1/FH2 domain-containing protein 3-like [Anneissia japonica]|uniref:FH1/FH2 domain-containing protein 3-like n=1 Tax=Anneissia japonica TaxID=1529436 RepID=UPI0014256551|nr:FH1/FH2 domain-containing protein 3-like [Anneissia japonica]